MKHFYKLIAACLVIVLFLSGCADADSTASSSVNAASAASSASAADPASKASASAAEELVLLMDGGQQWSLQGTADGYYDIVSQQNGNQLIYYTDYANMVQIPLCSTPSCDHSTPECTAWTTANGMFVYQDHIYQFQIPDYEFPYLEQADLNGTDRKTLVRLKKGQDFVPSGVAAAGNFIYYMTANLKTELSTINTTYVLNRLDLETGETQVIQSAENTNQFIVGVMGDRFVIKRFSVDPASLTNGMPEFILMDQSGNETPIQLPSFVDEQTWIYPDGDRLLIVNSAESSIVSFDLKTQACETLITDPLFQKFPGSVLISTAKEDNIIVNVGADYYICKDQTLTRSQHSYYSGVNASNKILAEVDGQYLVCRNFDTAPKTLAFISVEDYWNDLDQDTPIKNS